MRASLAFLVGAIQCVSAAPGYPGHGGHCKPMAGEVGAAFAMTNAPDNKVVAFSRASSGKLTQVGMFSTGGAGQGVDFDSDYGLQLKSLPAPAIPISEISANPIVRPSQAQTTKYLYAVSPASDTITVFSVRGSCLKIIQEIYGGDQPVGLTFSWEKKLMYALDQSVATPGIIGFRIKSDGTLAPINNQTIAISTPIGVPGTVLFVNDASGLIVANKVGSTLDYFSIDGNGEATLITTTASVGERPFGAWLSSDGTIFVVESGLPILTNAAISTYKPSTDGALMPITKSEKNQQTDGCWIVVTSDNKYAYTSNFASGTISSYSVGSDGSVAIIDGAAANLGNGSEPVDLAFSSDGKYLYCLLRGFGSVTALAIGSDGSLSSVGNFGQGQGLPPNDGASGLAVY